MMRRLVCALLACVCLSCGPPAGDAPRTPTTAAPAATAVRVDPPDEESSALRRAVAAMLAEVSRSRQLPIQRDVQLQTLTRQQVIARIKAKAERDLPSGVLEAQGELLRAFELTPVDYDFVGGIFTMVETNVAGLYDPTDAAMILLDDLPRRIVAQTLAHELVHALQDQHFDLQKTLKYTSGETDRISAAHCLTEGDATAVMIEMTQGVPITTMQLRLALVGSVAMSESGEQTPRVLQASLVAPYVDGYDFVQQLRKRGGWREVDKVWARLPASTEQMLHLDKYDAREPPIAVPDPPPPDESWTLRDADVLGEQGLRIALEQWTIRKKAIPAAAGWGGDRFIVAQRKVGEVLQHAVAWHVRFDSTADADEAAAVLRKALRVACRERVDLGPLAWRHQGDAIALVAGPYATASSGRLTSASRCGDAKKWLSAVLAKR